MVNPLLKKLQIKANFKVKIENAPEKAAGIFGDIPADVAFTYGETMTMDALIIFTTSKMELNNQIQKNLPLIHSKTIFWVFYPKKSSKISSDLDLMRSWDELGNFGLSPCASAAVNETWTALRLKLISEVKPSGMRNDHIKTNEFGDFIDSETKTVKLPADFQDTLVSQPKALAFFNSLSYTNRKEYVLWILSAKQEKTRQSRIGKSLELLLTDKKNPGAK